MQSTYSQLQPRSKDLSKPYIVLQGDNKTGKSILMSLLSFLSRVDCKEEIDKLIKEKPDLKNFYYTSKDELKEEFLQKKKEIDKLIKKNPALKSRCYITRDVLKKEILQNIIGIECDDATDYKDFFGDSYLTSNGEIDFYGARIKITTNQNLDEVLEKEQRAITFICLKGGDAFCYKINPAMNLVFVDRSGKTDKIIKDLHEHHYKAYYSTILSPKSYNLVEEKEALEKLSQREELEYGSSSKLEPEQTLIQLFILSELQAYLKINNPQTVIDLHENETDSLDTVLLKEQQSISEEFLDQTLKAVKAMNYDNSKKIDALLGLGLSVKAIQKYLGKFDTTNTIVKNILKNDENFEDSEKVISFLLEEYYPGKLDKVFKLIRDKYYQEAIRDTKGGKIYLSEANENIKHIFIKAISYLLRKGYKEQTILETVKNLGLKFTQKDLEDMQKSKYSMELNYSVKTEEYNAFKSRLLSKISPFGDSISPCYLENTIDTHLIKFLERYGKGLVAKIHGMRRRYDPNIFLIGGNINVNNRRAEKRHSELAKERIKYVKQVLGWSPNYLGIFEHNKDIELLTQEGITIPHWPKALPKLKERLEKLEKAEKNLEEKKSKFKKLQDKGTISKIYNFFLSKTQDKKTALEKTKQEFDKAKQIIKDTNYAVSNLKKETAELKKDSHKEQIDFEKGFNQMSFTSNLRELLSKIFGYLHPEEYKEFIRKYLIPHKEDTEKIVQFPLGHRPDTTMYRKKQFG